MWDYKKWYYKNHDKVLIAQREKDKGRIDKRKAYLQRPEVKARIKAYYQKYNKRNQTNKKYYLRRKIWKQHNHTKQRELENKRRKIRRKIDNNFREKDIIRSTIRQALRRGTNGTFTESEWLEIKNKSPICPMCGRFTECENLTLDHIFPIIRGGNNDITNIQALCLSCNCKKGDYVNESNRKLINSSIAMESRS